MNTIDDFDEEIVSFLVRLTRDETVAPAIQLEANKLLMKYGWGPPA